MNRNAELAFSPTLLLEGRTTFRSEKYCKFTIILRCCLELCKEGILASYDHHHHGNKPEDHVPGLEKEIRTLFPLFLCFLVQKWKINVIFTIHFIVFTVLSILRTHNLWVVISNREKWTRRKILRKSLVSLFWIKSKLLYFLAPKASQAVYNNYCKNRESQQNQRSDRIRTNISSPEPYPIDQWSKSDTYLHFS